MTPQETPTVIKQRHVLLVEGKDAERFFGALTRDLALTEIQVMDIGGKPEYRGRLRALVRTPGFENVISLGLVRDANGNPEGTLQSMRDALRAAGLCAPGSPLKVTLMVLPSRNEEGELEDLCMKALQKHPAMTCVEEYFQCLLKEGLPPPRKMSKAKMHAFLASRREPDRRLGEAADAGEFDWSDPVFGEVKKFLSQVGPHQIET